MSLPQATISINLPDEFLIAIGKLSVYMEDAESGLRSLIHGLLKVKIGSHLGDAITAELGNRDIQYILTAVTHELHPHTDFEIRLSDLLAQIEVVRTKRNLLLHSSWTRSTKPGVAHWSKISAKTKAGVKTDRGTISLTEITELAQKAQNICGEILLLHREIGAIW